MAALVLLAAPAASHARPTAKKKVPNILFILSDDHSSAAIACYGSWLGKYAYTPNLDKLAKQGMRFTNSLVTKPWQNLSFLPWDLE